ncbi:hypothetical protein ACKOUJ_07580 [Legionella pneumophila]|jgi:hypothetical protein|uniref:Uncharacterized protein n=1 Tax=Legionella pneumophila TaxID=446 RepID=A0AAN5R4V4_LEGPN|nr:hypothetical protein [Legionella pneumophila]HAT8831329.1 hypothetical protein [Legionella pneumophila subsp. pneumophila]TIH02161.1 hypothetical protein DI137_09800 [Legionella pneumophila]HAT1595948.1 hypothetical protein [Legionella pneumophila]HAT1971052.1 hypothetical protein [Legionella pneumophila]HAT1991197.1 hypothetical protein [Legionella pneumophila]
MLKFFKIVSVFLLLFTSLNSFAYKSNEEIINMCREKYSTEGSAVVKYCADKDIEARDQLSQYPQEYNDFIDRCLKEYESEGYSVVKYCADADIKAEKALQKY